MAPIIYHGIDLVDSERLEKIIARHAEHFENRVFTAAECEYCRRYRNRTERFAGRFAVKEAVMKMLGIGWQDGVAWTDIETVNDALGKPEVRLGGKLARRAQAMGISKISVSITHARGLAIASAAALG